MKNPTTKQIEKWCAALRSGKYKQGRGLLQTNDGYCCLGVACKVFIPAKEQCMVNGRLEGGTIIHSQPNAPIWLKKVDGFFAEKSKRSLMSLNDNTKLSFDEIADCLELVFIHKALDK